VDLLSGAVSFASSRAVAQSAAILRCRALAFRGHPQWAGGISHGPRRSPVLVFVLRDTWVSRALENVLSKNAPTTITDHDIGFAALVIWATHPSTWAIVFFGVEGLTRVLAALGDTVLGLLPLYLLEQIYSKIFHGGAPELAGAAKFSESHVSSYVGAMREKVVSAGLSQVPDEHYVQKNTSEEILEIRAWRAKPDWNPPRVVRYHDRYYRLEDCSRGSRPRPFVYKLRRLAAGVPGRTVLVYSPEEAPVTANR